MTTVSEAILSRRSIRAFLDKPVATDLITKIITQSARAPLVEIFNLGISMLSLGIAIKSF